MAVMTKSQKYMVTLETFFKKFVPFEGGGHPVPWPSPSLNKTTQVSKQSCGMKTKMLHC